MVNRGVTSDGRINKLTFAVYETVVEVAIFAVMWMIWTGKRDKERELVGERRRIE